MSNIKERQKFLKEEVSNYSFESFSGESKESGVSDHEFSSLESVDIQGPKNTQEAERDDLEGAPPESLSFSLSSIVRKSRGVDEKVKLFEQKKIEAAVAKKVAELEEISFKRGYQEGRKKAQQEVFNQTRAQVEEKISLLSDLITEVLKIKHEILASEKESVYILIKNLVKWVTLKELHQDGAYLYRLFERLILELQTKSHILIQVDPKNFDKMPDILEHVQEVVGKMDHVELAVDYDLDSPGLVLTTESEIVNGSLKEQFKSFDRIFAQILPPLEEEENLFEKEDLHIGELMDRPEIRKEKNAKEGNSSDGE